MVTHTRTAWVLTSALALGLLFAAAGCSGSEPAAPSPGSAVPTAPTPPKPLVGDLVVTYEYPNYSLPFVVALDKGFFLEEGVRVTPRRIGVKSGETVDLSVVDVINGHDFYLLTEQRGYVLAVHFFSRKADFEKAMLVKKSAGISDWKDFRGKAVVLTDGSDFAILNDVFAQHGLKALGIEGRDVTMKGGGGAIAGFPRDKDSHALYGSSSIVLQLMRQYPSDFELRWKDLGTKEGQKSPLVACSYVKASVLPQKKEAVRAYVRAIDRAIDLLREDREGAVAILPKYFDVDKAWAQNMEVFGFHKSDDKVDITTLSSKLGVDVRSHMLDLTRQ